MRRRLTLVTERFPHKTVIVYLSAEATHQHAERCAIKRLESADSDVAPDLQAEQSVVFVLQPHAFAATIQTDSARFKDRSHL